MLLFRMLLLIRNVVRDDGSSEAEQSKQTHHSQEFLINESHEHDQITLFFYNFMNTLNAICQS